MGLYMGNMGLILTLSHGKTSLNSQQLFQSATNSEKCCLRLICHHVANLTNIVCGICNKNFLTFSLQGPVRHVFTPFSLLPFEEHKALSIFCCCWPRRPLWTNGLEIALHYRDWLAIIKDLVSLKKILWANSYHLIKIKCVQCESLKSLGISEDSRIYP